MNNDKLRKFFESNRDEFDSQTPSTRVWKRIERTLFGTKEVTLWNSLNVWRAAAVLLLFLSIYQFLAPRLTGKAADGLVAQQEFSDVQSFYDAEINSKIMLIRSEGPFGDDLYTQDLQKLEAMYAVLSEELKSRPSQEVKDALVLNMLVRIDLLNHQLQRLEEARVGKQETSGT